MTADYLRAGGLSERFIAHMRGWPHFVHPRAPEPGRGDYPWCMAG